MKISRRKNIRKNTTRGKRVIRKGSTKRGATKKSRKRKMSGGVIFTKEQMNFKNAFRAEFMKAFEILKKDQTKGVIALKKLMKNDLTEFSSLT